MVNKLFRAFLKYAQRRCRHESNSVTADILEGASASEGIQWCRACGAYRFVFNPFNDKARTFQEWRLPQ